MPTSPHEAILCRYNYDPLDRLAASTPLEQVGIQRYYCKSRLTTEIQDAVQYSFLQHDDQLLAQQQTQVGKVGTALLATDQQRSVLSALDAAQPHSIAYSPYGHRQPETGLLSLLGFTGQRPDPVTGHYHLGNGYRAFNPVLLRFHCPDSLSPFGQGGLNAYAYCEGDPLNRTDPTGHAPRFLKALKKLFFSRKTSRSADVVSTVAQPPARPGTQTASIGKGGPSSSNILPNSTGTSTTNAPPSPTPSSRKSIDLNNVRSQDIDDQRYIEAHIKNRNEMAINPDVKPIGPAPGPHPWYDLTPEGRNGLTNDQLLIATSQLAEFNNGYPSKHVSDELIELNLEVRRRFS